MTTIMKASTFDKINDMFVNSIGVNVWATDEENNRSEWEICVYNDVDGYIKFTVTHIESGVLYLDAKVKDE